MPPIKRSLKSTKAAKPRDPSLEGPDEDDILNDDPTDDNDDPTDDGPVTNPDEPTGDDPVGNPDQPTGDPGQPEDPDPDNPPALMDDEPIHGAPRDGRTYRVGEKVIFKGEKRGGTIVALETVYRATRPAGTSRWRFHQILVSGSEVPSTKVRELQDGDFESEQL